MKCKSFFFVSYDVIIISLTVGFVINYKTSVSDGEKRLSTRRQYVEIGKRAHLNPAQASRVPKTKVDSFSHRVEGQDFIQHSLSSTSFSNSSVYKYLELSNGCINNLFMR